MTRCECRYKESRARVIKLQSLWRAKVARAQVQTRRSYVRSTSIQVGQLPFNKNIGIMPPWDSRIYMDMR